MRRSCLFLVCVFVVVSTSEHVHTGCCVLYCTQNFLFSNVKCNQDSSLNHWVSNSNFTDIFVGILHTVLIFRLTISCIVLHCLPCVHTVSVVWMTNDDEVHRSHVFSDLYCENCFWAMFQYLPHWHFDQLFHFPSSDRYGLLLVCLATALSKAE